MKKRILSLILASLMLLTLISCSSKEMVTDNGAYDYKAEDFEYSSSSRFDGASLGYVTNDAVMEEAEMEMPMEPEAPAPSPESTGNTKVDVTAGRKIIYSSSFTLETKEYDKSVNELNKIVDEYGAWFESSKSYGTAENGNRSSYYTVRVPVENYKAFISRQGSVGVVISSSENNRDVTEQYTDVEARLASATLREERVLKILESADRLDDVLSLERELADIRYEIESYTGSLRKYDSQVNYSTVTISLSEVTVITPTPPKTLTFGERLSKGFTSGIENFVDGFEDFVIYVSYNLIGLVFWAIVIIIVIVVIVKKVNKKKKKTTPAITETTPEEKK